MMHRVGSIGGDEGLMRGSKDRTEGLGSAGRGLINAIPGRYCTHKQSKNGLLGRYMTGRLVRNDPPGQRSTGRKDWNKQTTLEHSLWPTRNRQRRWEWEGDFNDFNAG